MLPSLCALRRGTSLTCSQSSRLSQQNVGSALQATVQKVWQRLSYHSVIAQEAKRQQDEYGHNEAWAFGISLLKHDDAIDTLIEVLHYKLHNDRWRRVFNYKQSREELQKYFGVPKSCLVV
ncbi:hypothetical protein CLOP_g8971 [Closterium sp. NIES-67]|nr:hypothetical protein CLOP_g8971 [Closterium sp. NIES-67]